MLARIANSFYSTFLISQEHIYANQAGGGRRNSNRHQQRRLSVGGAGHFYYQNQDFFSTINESSPDTVAQNGDGFPTADPSGLFPYNEYRHVPPHPIEPEFSSQSSREWEQDVMMRPNVLHEVSFYKSTEA